MRFVDHDIRKRELLERGTLDKADFVRRDANFEVLRDETGSDRLGAFFFRAGEGDNMRVWCPPFELACPVLESGFGDDDQVRTCDVAVVF